MKDYLLGLIGSSNSPQQAINSPVLAKIGAGARKG